ncbi:MAG: hypothetical protein ACREKM_06995 [Longimicrobiales bacterium]
MNLAVKHPRKARAAHWLAATGIAIALGLVTSSSEAQTFSYLACRRSADVNLDFCRAGGGGYFHDAQCGVYFMRHVQSCAQQ